MAAYFGAGRNLYAMKISRPRRALHAEIVRLCRKWMQENKVERADLIPYTAITSDDDAQEVALGRKISRARESYSLGRLAPESIALYEALPHWSWVPARVHPGPKPSIANALADRARLWLQATGTARADEIPGSAEITLPDGSTYKLGEALRNMRRRYAQDKLTAEEILSLEDLPDWTWTPPRQRPAGRQRARAPR